MGYRADCIDDGGTTSTKKGEIEIKIPVFDWGNLERDAAKADVLSRQNEYKQVVLSAGSEVRVAYGAYRTAFDIAKHYQDQVLPMQEALLEEANYNYNGMHGVFELLQAGRAKASAEANAIIAKQNTLAATVNLYSVLAGNQSDTKLDTIASGETRQDEDHFELFGDGIRYVDLDTRRFLATRRDFVKMTALAGGAKGALLCIQHLPGYLNRFRNPRYHGSPAATRWIASV